ncbi:MAG: nucleoside hydrolase, partial [Dysgonamonadaceae bacterium]|nr:nucleoside hydrolase [Dysgonamonadaceae bacterium]
MTNEPLAVILDTDMGNDIDDAMALDMLYKYMDAGKINLLGIVLNKDYRYSPEFIDIMAAWYGYPDVPVAALKKGKTLSIDDSNYTKTVSELKSNGKPLFERSAKNYNSLPQPVQLYRKLLAGQPDSSVTVISIGFLTNLAALLESGADEFSPLNGKELVSRKVKLLSVMAGSFTSNPYAEYNIVQDISSAKKVFSVCPVPVIVSPFEVGDSIRYPGVSIERDFKWATKHPLVEAYKAYMPNTSYDRSTWDLTLVLYVASGQDQTFFDRSRPGLISVDDKGCTHFVEKTD